MAVVAVLYVVKNNNVNFWGGTFCSTALVSVRTPHHLDKVVNYYLDYIGTELQYSVELEHACGHVTQPREKETETETERESEREGERERVFSCSPTPCPFVAGLLPCALLGPIGVDSSPGFCCCLSAPSEGRQQQQQQIEA